MPVPPAVSADVVTLRELARAAAASRDDAEHAIAALGVVLIDGRYVTWNDAVRVGRFLRLSASGGDGLGWAGAAEDAPVLASALFGGTASAEPRAAAMPAAVSGAVHGLAALMAVLLTSAGLGSTVSARLPTSNEPMRLVYLAAPGPGGGGGGGGARQASPPPRALKRGTFRQSSPVPRVVPPRSIEPPARPPEPKPEPPPELPVVAPVVTQPADETERPGVLEASTSTEESRGAGTEGGVGSGAGTGIGEGHGPGIGPGSGGGTGGGPYRPGSGIEPPRLLREVRADYTDQARRAGIQGEVVLEIVVRRDGTVGDVRVMQGLGHGLERRAADAVRQWRFSPARRLGTPVDVLVEVAVEFRLR